MLIQFCFFSAYFIVSLPAGMVVSRIGYQKGIVLGLAIACGVLAVLPRCIKSNIRYFSVSSFCISVWYNRTSGVCQPLCNGTRRSKTASSRLTMTQAFNAFGTTVAPFFGSYLIMALQESMEAVRQALQTCKCLT